MQKDNNARSKFLKNQH